MRLGRLRYRGEPAPPAGADLNFSHPLMKDVRHVFLFSPGVTAFKPVQDLVNPARQLDRRTATGTSTMGVAKGIGGFGTQASPIVSGGTGVTGWNLATCAVKEGAKVLTVYVRATTPDNRYNWDSNFNTSGESLVSFPACDDNFGGVNTSISPWIVQYFNNGTTKSWTMGIRTGGVNNRLSFTPKGDGQLENAAMTYDGATLKVYSDGLLKGSASASGVLNVAGSGGISTSKYWSAFGHGRDTNTGTRKSWFGVGHYIIVWERPLRASELQWLAIEPYAFIEGPVTVKYFVPVVTAPPQILSPSAITPSEAFGSDTITKQISLSPSAIASAEALGSDTVYGTLGATGISSGETFGTADVIGASTVVPSGAASSESFGTSYVQVPLGPSSVNSGEVFGLTAVINGIGAVAIPSAEAFGTPGVATRITVSPSSIASALAFGNTDVRGGLQYLVPRSFESSAWGLPALVGGSDAQYLLINGVNIMSGAVYPSGIEMRSAKITKQLASGYASATFTFIDQVGSYRPTIGQDVRFGEFGRLEFAGLVQAFTDEVFQSTGTHKYSITCSGYSDLASRRVYSTIYPVGSGGYNIIVDIVKNGLSGEGVTYNHVDTPWSVNEAPGLQFIFKKVNEILDGVRDYSPVPADFWFIDDYKDLHFHSAGSAVATDGLHFTPFTLTAGTYRNLKIAYDQKEYRNVQYVRTNKNFDFARRTETVIVTSDMIVGGDTFVLTQFPIVDPPTVTINGSDVDVLSIEEPGAYAGWTYIPGGVGINNEHVALVPGDVVVLLYNSYAVNMVKEEDTAAIAARQALEPGTSGRVENIFEAKDVDETQARQIALGLLQQYAQLFPIITYETDIPDIQVGVVQPVDITDDFGLAGNFVVTQVDSVFMENDLGHRSSFRRQVTLSTTDSNGNAYKFLGQLIVRTNQGTVDTQHEKATLLVTDGPIPVRSHVGSPYQVKRNGIITGVSGAISVPPNGDLIRIDVLLNGESIFKAGQYLELKTTVAADEIVASGALDPRRINVVEGDVISFDILNSDDGTARDMSVVVTMETPR